jgi:hypothetical protein
MATPAKNPYLINKITFFQFGIFIVSCKYTLTLFILLQMKYLLLILIPVMLAGDCNKKANEISSCIQQKIDVIKTLPKWNPPATVNEYIYQGKHVYLFSADCCDQYHELYDENCNYICAPSGGITGKGDGKCPDFSSASQFVKLVWKDSR